MRKYTLVLLFAMLSIYAHAQVFTMPAGAFYTQISASSLQYDQAFDRTGAVVDIPASVDQLTIHWMAQYGINSRWTVRAAVPYSIIRSTVRSDVSMLPYYLESGSLTSFGNVEAGVFYKMIDDKPFVTLSFFTSANTAALNYYTGLQSDYPVWHFKPGAGVGWAYDKSWLTFYVGADIFTGDYSTAFLSEIEAGYKPFPFMYIAADIYVRRSLDNGEACDCTMQYTSLYLNDMEYLSLAAKAGYTYNQFGLNLGLNTAVSASNAPATLVATVGLQYKFEKAAAEVGE
ncbi:MAG: hypothetical protein R2794_13480 [Chitinophagales bacterium]